MLKVHINTAGYDRKDGYLENVHFEVLPGEIVGLIGANGAGKSTTIKSIIGVMKYMNGSIDLPDQAELGYIPEEPILYEFLTLWEHLALAAASFHLQQDKWESKVEELLDIFKLTSKKDAFPIHFSKGMKQKTLIVLSFMIQADVYIIDEPFIGLDPVATKNLIRLIKKEKARGAAILMSTHVLDTAEKICDRFILLDEGHILAEGNLTAIQKKASVPKTTSLLDCFYTLLEGEDIG